MIQIPARELSKFVCGTIWAIMPEKLQAILELLDGAGEIMIGSAVSLVEARKRATRFKNVAGHIAILPLFGIISQRGDYFCGTSTDRFAADFDQAIADETIGAIVLDVDSPGGMVSGVGELADRIHAARGAKPIIAVANSLAASAAYWIASSADEIVVTGGGEIGSIGVLAVHFDLSSAAEQAGLKVTIIKAGRYKAEESPYAPLSDEAQEAIQKRVDDFYAAFTGAVARNRGVSRRIVENDFGQGRIMTAGDAVESGMADRVGTFVQVLSDLGATAKTKASRGWAMDRAIAIQEA